MNPKHLPSSAPGRARCPVCHQAVYSRAGIHPQCAVRQSELPKGKDKAVVPADVVIVEETLADLTPVVEPPAVALMPVPALLPAAKSGLAARPTRPLAR